MSNNRQKQFSEKPTNKANFGISNSEELLQQPDMSSEVEQAVYETEPTTQKKQKTRADKKLKITGLVLAGLFAVSMFFMPTSSSVNTSEEAKLAIENQMSTQLPIGVRIMSNDENLAGQDLTITHSSPANENKIHIWDYAAEDGDYVQIIVDGAAIGDPFMIKNKSVSFTVPTTGEIQVLGTRDGGGGITYAVHYEVNGTTYFNGTDVGDGNLYTLIRE